MYNSPLFGFDSVFHFSFASHLPVYCSFHLHDSQTFCYCVTCLQDGIGDFFADSDAALYWVSFLDGMQRVLLFTEDFALATVAQQVSCKLQLCACTFSVVGTSFE
jgi:hypothetical protein